MSNVNFTELIDIISDLKNCDTVKKMEDDRFVSITADKEKLKRRCERK